MRFEPLRWLPSERQLERDGQALDAYRKAFAEFSGGNGDRRALRNVMTANAGSAERALGAAFSNDVGPAPLEVVNDLVRPGVLAEVAATTGTLKRDSLGFAPDVLTNWLAVGAQALVDHRARVRRRHRNPLRWLDGLVRFVLRIPAYVVSRVLGVPMRDLEARHKAWLLRLVVPIGLAAIAVAKALLA